MTTPDSTLTPDAAAPAADQASRRAQGRNAITPLDFLGPAAAGSEIYLQDPVARALAAFFQAKGLPALKDEDRRQQWYDDWVAYQARHSLYASLLVPAQFSARGGSFDLLRYARFLEVFAYCSPAHGYSLQVSFLGFFSILMGSNATLKREAAAALEAGQLLAFGVSEKAHGSDLLANEFNIAQAAGQPETLRANGTKFYIGNADVAAIISTLGRKIARDGSEALRAQRAPFMLVALRPGRTDHFTSLGKISTLGVRAANVGAFKVTDYPLTPADVIAEGRAAWDAAFGTVTLGKFFLGMGSIGICEHALAEAVAHLRTRILYGKPVTDMPHIRSALTQAYARLTAMKLFAYRALDYLHAASPIDRRYLFYCAVQKAKVSVEGIKVMALLQDCIGAKGFESDTYFEMALRDAPLIPSLEGSRHINLGLAGQFLPRYFDRPDQTLVLPPSLVAGEVPSRENPYLMEARMGATHAIAFRPFLEPYHPLSAVPNVALFARQAAAFRRFLLDDATRQASSSDTQISLALGEGGATIGFAQLIAENSLRLEMPAALTAVIFGLLVEDLSTWALRLASTPQFNPTQRQSLLRLLKVPRSSAADWEHVGQQCLGGAVPA